MSPLALRTLLDWLRIEDDSKAKPADAYVFSRGEDKELKSFRKAWELTRKRAMLQDVRFHDPQKRICLAPGRAGRSVIAGPGAGMYRVDRHGAHPVHVLPMPTPAGPVPDDLVAGLIDRGRRFVLECWTTYHGWTPPTLTLLHEAGRLVDDLEQLRGQQGERAAQRLLLATVAAL